MQQVLQISFYCVGISSISSSRVGAGWAGQIYIWPRVFLRTARLTLIPHSSEVPPPTAVPLRLSLHPLVAWPARLGTNIKLVVNQPSYSLAELWLPHEHCLKAKY